MGIGPEPLSSSGRSHQHDWRIVSVSQEEFVEVTEWLCATCSAVSFSGPIGSPLTARAESRAFVRVLLPSAASRERPQPPSVAGVLASPQSGGATP